MWWLFVYCVRVKLQENNKTENDMFNHNEIWEKITSHTEEEGLFVHIWKY